MRLAGLGEVLPAGGGGGRRPYARLVSLLEEGADGRTGDLGAHPAGKAYRYGGAGAAASALCGYACAAVGGVNRRRWWGKSTPKPNGKGGRRGER